MGSKKSFNKETPPEAKAKKFPTQIIVDPKKARGGFLFNRPAPGHGAPIEICSVIPHTAGEANWLYHEYNKTEFKEIRNLLLNAIGLGKWGVNMLMGYKRNIDPTFTQKDIYVTGKDYTKNYRKDLKRATEKDLSFLTNNPEDYGEVNTTDKEWMLWNYINKANKIFLTIPEDQDTGRLKFYLDHALSSSYRICAKMKKYTEKYGSGYMDKHMYKRNIPW